MQASVHLTFTTSTEKHDDDVKCLAVTRNGSIAVSGASDNTIRVWDTESGECLRTIKGHSERVNSIALAADDRLIVTGAGGEKGDNSIRLWDLASGECLRTLNGHTKPVNGLNMTQDGRLLVSSSADMTICVWDPFSGRCLNELSGYPHLFVSVNLTPDGNTVVAGNNVYWVAEKGFYYSDESFYAWDLRTGSRIREFGPHKDEVWCTCMTLDGRTVVSGTKDGLVSVWDFKTGARLNSLEGHSKSVECVRAAPDGRLAMSGGMDGTVRLWELGSDRWGCVGTLRVDGTATSISELREGKRFCVGTSRGRILFVRVDNISLQRVTATGTRAWLFNTVDQCGNWDLDFTFICEGCGRRSNLPDSVADIFREVVAGQDVGGLGRILRRIGNAWPRGKGVSRCFWLPERQWDDERLRSECCQCHRGLQFNPFLLDNSRRY